MGSVDKQNSSLYKFIFCILGISSLIGWNAVLSSFPFFSSKYGPRVFNLFTIPLQIGNCLVGAFMPIIAPKISLMIRIAGSMIILSIILISLPIIATILPSEVPDGEEGTDLGFIISVILTFFIGCLNSLAQNSMIALAAQEGGALCAIYWIATGLSGLLMAILACICTAIFPPQGEYEGVTLTSIIIFFAFATIISIFSIYLTSMYIKNEKKIKDDQLLNEEITSEEETNYEAISEEGEQQKFVSKIKVALKHAGFIPFYIWLIYVITFTVYPGLMLASIVFTTPFLAKQQQLWGQQFLNLTFQIGDVIGKTMGGYNVFHKKTLQYILVLARGVFIATGVLVAYDYGGEVLNNNWFPFINVLLVAVTNGFTTAGLMALGPKSGKGNKSVIETIGFICAFALTSGIAFGSILAYPVGLGLQ